MRKPLFMGTSDWHLERNAWVRYPDLCGDAYYALEQIVDKCIDYHIPLLAAGDLFDKAYPDSRSVSVAMQQMDRMDNEDLQVFFTQGQHEYAKDSPWLGLHHCPVYLHKKMLKISHFELAGLDYTKPHELDEALKIAKNADILMCHQVWGNFMGTIRTVDGKLEQIPMNGGLILTGDYHKHCQFRVVPQSSGKSNLALSPGSTCLQSIDEPASKAIYLIYNDLSCESIPLKSRSCFYHDLLKEQDLEDFLATINQGWLEFQDGVPDNIAKPILSIKYNPEIPDVYQRIIDGIGPDRAHLFIRPVTRELDKRTVEIGAAQETIDLGLEGNLAKLCDKESSTYEIARRLLTCTNLDVELEQIENEFLSEGV